MYSDHGDSIYSPETVGLGAAENAIVLRQREHQQQIVAWESLRRQQQRALSLERQQIENQRAVVLQQQAENWTQSDRIRSEKATVEHELALVRRDKEALARQERELRKREDLRRRNRTTSLALIEDTFAGLSAKSVLEYLTHSSARIRKHARDNVSSCITGYKDAPSTFVRFTVQDIAPEILPKLRQIVSASKVVDDALKFCEDVVSSPPVVKALALSGQCPRLADFLIESNERVSRLAILSMRQMVGMDATVVKATYDALAAAIPHLPIPDSPESPSHPAVQFIQDVTPKIIADCFNNALWSAVAPLVTHRVDSIRRVALRKIALEAQTSDRTRHGLVEVHILGLLDQVYQSPSPLSDVVGWFVDLLPLLAEKMCRNLNHVYWMIRRINDPSPKIQNTVIEALRACASKDNPVIHNVFVKADLLRQLGELAQLSKAIKKLISELLSVLAIPHARAKASVKIITYLDNPSATLSKACLAACKKIVDSTAEDRADLYSSFSKLNFSKESTLMLCDYAMPVFCRDWATASSFSKIADILQHSEQRVRRPAQLVWLDIVSNSPIARAKLAHDNLVRVVFDLCASQYEDAVTLGAQCCSTMAIEILNGGTSSVKRLLALLRDPRPIMRQSASRGVLVIAEKSDEGCNLLLSAGAFDDIKVMLESHPRDDLEHAHKLLVRLAPFLSTSSDACAGLLQLLDSKTPQVESATRAALASISFTNIKYRETLRKTILDRLLVASDNLVEFSALAIQEWIGPDLAQLNDFTTFFNLASHSNRRIQVAALSSLKQKVQDQKYQESMEKANVVYLIRSLTSSEIPEAIDFVATALTSLAMTLAKKGHVSVIVQLLASGDPAISGGASTALEAITNGSQQDRKALLDDNIIERLSGDQGDSDSTTLYLLSVIIPKLVFDYLSAGKIDVILPLVEDKRKLVRLSANNAILLVAGGTVDERARLCEGLLPHIPNAHSALLEVAAKCLSRSLARDLVSEGDFIRVFRLLEIDDVRIREPLTLELQKHIQSSDETARGRLIDADILPSMLQPPMISKEDILSFMTDCVLPNLAPAISRNNGGTSIFPLLRHEEPRLRAAAAISIRNAVDSRHGDVEKIAGARVVANLHPLIETDDTIRDLWCYLLPKAAIFLANRQEIEILFESLSDRRETVRKAASESMIVMAKASEGSRLQLFPILIRHLDNPPDVAIHEIAQAVSLSGSAFLSNGNEGELLYLAEHGKPTLKPAAVEAITNVLAKGGSYEHQKLMAADVFPVAMRLYVDPSQRQISLKLLYAIISHLGNAIVADEQYTRDLFSLFDDPDTRLSQHIYQSLTSDPRVLENSTLPELIPVLFTEEKIKNPSVSNFLRYLAPYVVPRLVGLRRMDIIVTVLTVKEISILKAYLEETCTASTHATEPEKDRFVFEPYFVPTLGNYLKSRDVTLRRVSSDMINWLSKGSSTRSARMMEEGIGSSLAFVAVNGERGVQQASLLALRTLFLTAPDHADRLVAECLPALCDIMEDPYLSPEIYGSSLDLLSEISLHSSHSFIIECGIIGYLVEWMSPQHSITDPGLRDSLFEICRLIAHHSDPGRKALIDKGVMDVLSRLVISHIANNVINACKVLDALARTGTYSHEIKSSGIKNVIQKTTGIFHKSPIANKAERKLAQNALKQVLLTLRDSQRLTKMNPNEHSRTLQRSWSTMSSSTRPDTSHIQSSSLGGVSRPHPRRVASEAVAYESHDYQPRVRRVVSESNQVLHNGLRRHQAILPIVSEDRDEIGVPSYQFHGPMDARRLPPQRGRVADNEAYALGHETSPSNVERLATEVHHAPAIHVVNLGEPRGSGESMIFSDDGGLGDGVPVPRSVVLPSYRSMSFAGRFNDDSTSGVRGPTRIPPSYRTALGSVRRR